MIKYNYLINESELNQLTTDEVLNPTSTDPDALVYDNTDSYSQDYDDYDLDGIKDKNSEAEFSETQINSIIDSVLNESSEPVVDISDADQEDALSADITKVIDGIVFDNDDYKDIISTRTIDPDTDGLEF